jgi:hypothetical protein
VHLTVPRDERGQPRHGAGSGVPRQHRVERGKSLVRESAGKERETTATCALPPPPSRAFRIYLLMLYAPRFTRATAGNSGAWTRHGHARVG